MYVHGVIKLSNDFVSNFFQTDKRIPVSENQSFVHFQTDMVRLAKQIARTAKDIVSQMSVLYFHCLVYELPFSVWTLLSNEFHRFN